MDKRENKKGTVTSVGPVRYKRLLWQWQSWWRGGERLEGGKKKKDQAQEPDRSEDPQSS